MKNKTFENSNDWTNEIQELNLFFSEQKDLPKKIQLDKGSTIVDIEKFLKSHFEVVIYKNGINTFLPALERLKKLKQIIESN